MLARLSTALTTAVILTLGLGAAPSLAQAPSLASPSDGAAPDYTRPGELPAGSVITDGSIDDLVRVGDRIYATGWFEQVGRYQGGGDRLDASGAALTSPQLADGQISVEVADGAGGWYLGGDFTAIGGEESGGLAHVLADGTLDPDFLPVTDGLVSAMALVGSTLYVGGDFTKVGATTRAGLAALSAVDGSVLPLDAPQTGRVTELAAGPGALYVGTEDRLSAVDPVTGGPLPGFAPLTQRPVHALALGGGHLYVGTDRLLSLDPVTGSPDPAFAGGAPEKHRAVHSVLWTSSRLYVGSDRSDRLQALDPETGAVDASFTARLEGSNESFGGPGGVYDLALDGDRLWVAGSFTSADGVASRGLAVLDSGSGHRIDLTTPAYDQQVNAVELSGDAVFVGGTFSMTDWVRTRNIAALDAETLEPIPGFRVKRRSYGELVATSDALYMSANHFQGYDRHSGQHPYSSYTTRIPAFDPDTGAPLPRLSLKLRNLSGATFIGDRLYVAQRLGNKQKFPRNKITVYVDGRRKQSFTVPLRGYITTLDSIRGDLLVAGSFKRRASGGPRNTALIRIDARTGARRAYFDPHIDGPVYEVAVARGAVYASGLFRKVFEGYDVDRPGLTKMSARSAKSESFAPTVGGPQYEARLRMLGDVLWLHTWNSHFLDPKTGQVVAGPALPADVRPSAMTTTPGGYAFSSITYANLGGHGFSPVGFISPTD